MHIRPFRRSFSCFGLFFSSVPSTLAFVARQQRLLSRSTENLLIYTIQLSFNLCQAAFTSNLDWLQFVGSAVFVWNNCFFNNFGHNWNKNKEWMTIYIVFSFSCFEELFVLFISSFVWKQYLRGDRERESERERESKEREKWNKTKASAYESRTIHLAHVLFS